MGIIFNKYKYICGYSLSAIEFLYRNLMSCYNVILINEKYKGSL